MENSDTMIAIRYIFILTFLLIIVAYWGGSTHVIGAAGTVLGNLGNTFSGRNNQGQFANYPGGGPTS